MLLLPKLENDLAALPHGLDGDPEFRIKGSLLRALIRSRPVSLSAEVPPLVRELIEDPLLASTWIPGVRYQAALLVLRDIGFDSDAEFVTCIRNANAELFSSTMYCIMLFVASPRVLISGFVSRWKTFA